MAAENETLCEKCIVLQGSAFLLPLSPFPTAFGQGRWIFHSSVSIYADQAGYDSRWYACDSDCPNQSELKNA
jgi:hypothetical protein